MRAAALALILAAGPTAALAQGAGAIEPITTIPGPADAVMADRARMMISHGRTVSVFDMADPVRPRRIGAHTVADKIWDIQPEGDLVYVAADKQGLQIIEITASGLLPRGGFKTPGQAKSIGLAGHRALVADHMAGVDFVDVSNPDRPFGIGDYFVEGYARAVDARGTIGVAVDAPTGFYVFDLASSKPLEAVAVLQAVEKPEDLELVVANGKVSMAVAVGGGKLFVVDLRDPAAPRRAAAMTTPGGEPQAVAVDGTNVVVADGTHGVQFYEAAEDGSLRSVASYKTPKPARDIAIAGNLIFVLMGDLGVPRVWDAAPDGEILVLRRN